MLGRIPPTVAFAAAIILISACSTAIEGNPTTTAAVTPSDTAWIASVLPDAAELSRIVKSQTDEIDPIIGDATDLRDTMSGSEITESQCISVISPLERRTFEGAPVREVAYATLPYATLGALALPSAEDARSLFDTFVEQWRQCGGKTVVKSSGVDIYDNAIGDVDAGDRVISAVIVMSAESTGMRMPTERALGVAENCIIDVQIHAATSSSNDLDGAAAAVELVELMMTKVPTARQ